MLNLDETGLKRLKPSRVLGTNILRPLLSRRDGPQWLLISLPASKLSYSYLSTFILSLQIFQANNNSFAVHHNIFEKPLVTRYIRVNPRTWENAICLRLEVFGCDGKSIKIM